MPLVSTVLLSYNQGEFVRDAVESVLAQTFTDHELIIVENGSTDGSQDILRQYAGRPNVRLLLHERNEPITQRLNQGIAAAQGKYIALLFSDDYFVPNKLAEQVAAFATLDASYGVVYSPSWHENALTGQRWLAPHIHESGNVLAPLLRNCPDAFIDLIAPLYRRECFEAYPFYEDLFQEGETIVLRLALRWKFHFRPEPMIVMRHHGRNIGKAVKRNAEIFQILMERLVRDPDFPVEYRPLVRALRGRALRLAGWLVLRVNGDPQWARRMLLKTAQVEWRNGLHPKTFIGVGLSMLPAVVRRQTNRLLNAITQPSGEAVLLEDYR